MWVSWCCSIQCSRHSRSVREPPPRGCQEQARLPSEEWFTHLYPRLWELRLPDQMRHRASWGWMCDFICDTSHTLCFPHSTGTTITFGLSSAPDPAVKDFLFHCQPPCFPSARHPILLKLCSVQVCLFWPFVQIQL